MSTQLSPEQQANLRERLAALEYQHWARGASYFLGHLSVKNLVRWDRQCRIPYENLPEEDKNRSHERADKILRVLREFLPEIEVPEGDPLESLVGEFWVCDVCSRHFHERRDVPGGLECPFCRCRNVHAAYPPSLGEQNE